MPSQRLNAMPVLMRPLSCDEKEMEMFHKTASGQSRPMEQADGSGRRCRPTVQADARARPGGCAGAERASSKRAAPDGVAQNARSRDVGRQKSAVRGTVSSSSTLAYTEREFALMAVRPNPTPPNELRTARGMRIRCT